MRAGSRPDTLPDLCGLTATAASPRPGISGSAFTVRVVDDADPVALSWWTGLSRRDRTRYRRRVHSGHDILLPHHALTLAAAGLDPPGWWIVGPESTAADNDRIHRFDVILGGGRKYPMPDPVRRLILTDLDRTPFDEAAGDSPPRWWTRLRSPYR